MEHIVFQVMEFSVNKIMDLYAIQQMVTCVLHPIKLI